MKNGSAVEVVMDSAELTNPAGLHARPSVRLTGLAKSFGCAVEIALSPEGPWVDAKSPVKVMRVKASCGSVLHVRTTGAGANAAAEAVMALVREGFGEHGGDPHG